MKRILIAILVVSAGAAGISGILFGHRGNDPLRATAEETASISVNPGLNSGLTSVQPQNSATMQPTPINNGFQLGLKALSARNVPIAIAMRDGLAEGSIERLTLTWAIAVSGQTTVSSDELHHSALALAAWPGASDIRANLEKALFRESAPAQKIKADLAGEAPVTPEGRILEARVATADGDKSRATTLISKLWRWDAFDSKIEDAVMSEFGTLLTAGDDKARMDLLLYQEKFPQAARFADRSGSKPLFEAFVAVVKKTSKAPDLIKKLPSSVRQDPDFIFLSIRRLRQLRRYEDAAALFATVPKDTEHLVDPGAWWTEARIISRGLFDMGDKAGAYKLVDMGFARSPADIADAEFHAGWYAIRGLKDPDKAATHFRNLLAASPAAHDQARAHYWLGRALDMKSQGTGDNEFRKAAAYPGTFYGQLAGARLNAFVAPLQRYQILPGESARLCANVEMQAIRLLKDAGEDSRARRLYLAYAAELDKPADLQILAASALADYGPSLALAISKTAQKQGHDPGMAAFPLGAIPDSADISGAGKALAYAIARQESAFNPTAISAADARGLLQILPSTAKKVAKRYQIAWAEEKLINDPAYNATLGSHYLGEQINRFGGSYILTFAAYNAGPARIPQWISKYGDPRGKRIDEIVDWIESIPFQETRDYVQRVMENYQVYKSLLGEHADIEADLAAGTRQ